MSSEYKNYLTIEALEDSLTVSLSRNACEYCIDEDGNWKTLSADTPTKSINAGQTLSFRGNLIPVGFDGIGTFTISKKCNVLGNVMSMLFGDDGKDSLSLRGKNYSFYRLFYNCNNIISAKDLYLPATTLAGSCYREMFSDCTLLTTAPTILPATTLTDFCYGNMFAGCTLLTIAPKLPATTLAGSCYVMMFCDCTSLTIAPELPATTLTSNCYQQMFKGCTSLTTAPKLPATTLAIACYSNMFCDCTSLTTAPKLPTTTLANWCYSGMFYNCTKLNYIKMLATNISASYCLNSWVSDVSSIGTFVKHPNMTSLPTGTSGIPDGWTVQDAV